MSIISILPTTPASASSNTTTSSRETCSLTGGTITHIESQQDRSMATDDPENWGQLRKLNDHELRRLVDGGRERDSWMAMSSAALDDNFRSTLRITDGESAQHPFRDGLAPLHEWTDYVVHDPPENTLAPIRVALASLKVGFPTTSAGERNVLPQWEIGRQVDTISQPHGYNIHLQIVQDKDYKMKYPPSNARLDAIFNIVDGVIVVRKFVEPKIPPARPGDDHGASDRLPCWRQLDQILFMAWMKLHLPVEETSSRKSHVDFTGDSPLKKIANANDATLSQATGIGANLKWLELRAMMPWLNWILINNRLHPVTLQVIRRCLELRGFFDGDVPNYDRRQTFSRGHWAFYALLGTHTATHVTNLLALRKDNKPVDATMVFGRKIIQSITIFKPEDSDALTDQERREYTDHPVMIFEIRDQSASSDLQRRLLERHYSAPYQGYPHIANDPI